MQKGLVTVVIPIYNGFKYFNRCVESVVNQTYRNIEIILVDDGSKDGSSHLCDVWADKDKRIKVIHKENAGQGIARNNGIALAQGESICFIDSDDYIKSNMIESAVALMEKEKSDIVVFGLECIEKNNKTSKIIIPTPKKNRYNGEEIIKEFLPDLIGRDPYTGFTANLYMSAWVCLYSMRNIRENNWEFISEREIYSEDTYSLLNFYKNVNRVSILKEALYCYCSNDGISYSRTIKDDWYLSLKEYHRKCVRLCRELEYPEKIIERLSQLILSFMIAAMNNAN